MYGQLVLTYQAVAELGDGGDVAEVRRAARTAGRRLGWRVRTHVANGTLVIIDDRDPPQGVRELAARRCAEAVSAVIARAQAEERMFRTSAFTAFPTRPGSQAVRPRASERSR